ncbi:ATP-binding protein [Streptomyces sp. NPDC050095]|uniref:ATP-binding protein n=1 Tax=unclassified Streptomyces TaxID=2593676 RepID=UPI0034321550
MNLAVEAEPLGLARDEVREALADHAPASNVDDTVLVMSELVSNAVRHTRSGPDCMSVEIYEHAAVVWVHDADPDVSGVIAGQAQEPFLEEELGDLPEGGRGLRIVEALSVEWFVRRTAIGKAVVAVVGFDDAEAGAAVPT